MAPTSEARNRLTKQQQTGGIHLGALTLYSLLEQYKNLSGNSGVAAYEIARDSITVEFEDGGTYLYTKQSAGFANIKQMKLLAKTGQGLCTFIVNNVREKYAAKLR